MGRMGGLREEESERDSCYDLLLKHFTDRFDSRGRISQNHTWHRHANVQINYQVQQKKRDRL